MMKMSLKYGIIYIYRITAHSSMERSFISCQRKDGRYAYKYMDANGKPQFVYVWKLTAAD